jgi:hypothetical protein
VPCTTDALERMFSIPDVRLVLSFALAIAFQACRCSRCGRASGGRRGSSSRSPIACRRLRLRSHERFGCVRDVQHSVRIPGQCAFSCGSPEREALSDGLPLLCGGAQRRRNGRRLRRLNSKSKRGTAPQQQQHDTTARCLVSLAWRTAVATVAGRDCDTHATTASRVDTSVRQHQQQQHATQGFMFISF